MKKQILIISMSLLLLSGCHRGPRHDAELRQLLEQLDQSIADRQMYIDKKEGVIDSLRTIYNQAATPAEQFDALGLLFDEYRSYNADSSMVMCQRRMSMANELGDEERIIHANLNFADQLMYTSMYREALSIVEPLTSADVPEYLRSYLFHIKRTTYGLLSDYSMVPEYAAEYMRLTDMYRDSILSVNDPDGLVYQIVLCDQMNAHGEAQKAVDHFTRYLEENNLTDQHNSAIASYTLAESFDQLGDKYQEEKQLILSAINDMQSPAREYISLRRLALMLYQQGDVKHAYKYLKLCMEDAQECNARQRIVEINSIFPVVNEVYLDTIARERRNVAIVLAIMIVLALFLLVSLIVIRKQMRKVSEARHSEHEMNAKLKELNQELKGYNERLLEANQAIAENSYLKEEYIAKYMDQCLGYIDKLDSYRKTLHKLALAERTEELKRQTKSVAFIDGELKDFYDNFDETFLKLFPTFVADFNSLLRPDQQIVPKHKGRLNTELRIFALIRLGINDSVKIAKFLRYSVTTIYNYRTRVRNRAAGDRDRLEDDLMSIGRNVTP